jgi:hypothetical protein
MYSSRYNNNMKLFDRGVRTPKLYSQQSIGTYFAITNNCVVVEQKAEQRP